MRGVCADRSDGNAVHVFVEDLDRPGFAGLLAEEPRAPRAIAAEHPESPVFAVLSNGPRSLTVAAQLAAFKQWLAEQRELNLDAER